MARYRINELNYITSGENRTLLNMDVTLDNNDFLEYIHLLAIEPPRSSEDSPLSHDILLEQAPGDFRRTEYIQAISSYWKQREHHPKYYHDDVSSEISTTFLSGISEENDNQMIILNEQQRYYHETEEDKRQYVRLYLSCCSESYRKKLFDFFNANVRLGHTYVIEHDQIDGDTNGVTDVEDGSKNHPIYDIDDVALKSKNTSRFETVDDFDLESPKKTEDYYIPSNTGIQNFCQVDNNTYMLTKQTHNAPEYVKIDTSSDVENTSHYHMVQNSREMNTYLYAKPSDYGYQKYSDISSLDASQMFSTVNNFENIQYNYIAEVPMKEITKTLSKSDYDNGNVYCDILNTKNMYDSQYSMQMSSDQELHNCRDYVEINKCGDKVYLKYHDVQNYDRTKSYPYVYGYSYPKIEMMNKISNKLANNHKTYFFSVNIDDIDLSYDQTKVQESRMVEEGKVVARNSDTLKRNMVMDIKTAVKDIIRNVCPVQTQLFDVYFNGDHET